jgi:hypothetical protein
MTGLRKGARLRAAIGLIAAYAIALQTLFAAFAPLPANAQGADFAGWHVLCFGSGNSAPSEGGDPAAPASGTFHCVLCGSALAAAAVLPPHVVEPVPHSIVSTAVFASAPAAVPTPYAVRTGSARAPPLTV